MEAKVEGSESDDWDYHHYQDKDDCFGIYHDYYDQRQDAGRRHGMIVCYGNDNHFTRTKDDVMTRGGLDTPKIDDVIYEQPLTLKTMVQGTTSDH